MTMTDIRQHAAIPAGFRVTYAEDTSWPGYWFAVLRDEQGRAWEAGLGDSQDAARAHLMERIGRREAEGALPSRQPAPAPDTRLHTLAGHIAALAAAGYEVAFTPAGAHEVAAHVEKDGDPGAGCTALGATPAEALWAASPLHGDGVPFVVTDEGARDQDIRTLSDDMTDVFDRLDALEEQGKTVRPLVWMLVGLMVDANPDGELARQMRAEREAAAAASPN